MQHDLDILCDWAQTWHMTFNVAKCKVMHLGYGRINHEYFMNDQKLEIIDSEKDLGVVVTSNLKLGEQCRQAYAKANIKSNAGSDN